MLRMYFGDMFVDHRVEKAVLECIAERGIDATDVETVAARLQRGRSTLYAQYGNWQKLLVYTHQRALESIGTLFDCAAGDRRLEFDEWWARLRAFLCEPAGRGFLQLRTRVSPAEPPESKEVEQLPALIAWVNRNRSPLEPSATAVTQVIWLLALSAATCPAKEIDLRELAWALVDDSRTSKGDDELNLDSPEALAPLL